MFKNILKDLNQEIYTEANYSLGEFTFGFELEAWFDEDAREHEVQEWADEFWDGVKIKFPDKISGEVVHDDDPTIMPQKCESCSGTGRVPCFTCDGRGTIVCSSCDGSGTEDCTNCNGTGKEACSYCGGDGSIVMNENCPDCDGSGVIENEDGIKTDCPTCEGRGYIIQDCPECEGSGEQECRACDGYGTQTCQECYGDGEHECYDCYGDGEIECPDCDGNGYEKNRSISYEMNSPVLKFQPATLQKVIQFLTEGLEQGFINTNESCGFHIHLGFPDKLKRSEDIFWALCHIASKDKGQFLLSMLSYKGIDLYQDDYSRFMRFNDLRQSLDYLGGVVKSRRQVESEQKKDINESKAMKNFYKDEVDFWRPHFNLLYNYFNNDKYLIFRQHPQGTLEWRGARGFMNEGKVENIKDFMLTKLYPFVKNINEFLNEKYLILGESNVKLDREIFDILLKERRAPASRVGVKSKKFLQDQRPETIEELFKEYKNLGKAKITRLIVTKKDGDRFRFKGGIIKGHGGVDTMPKMDDNCAFETTNLERVQVDGGATAFCSITDCYLKHCVDRQSAILSCDIVNGVYTESRIQQSVITDGIFYNASLSNCNISGGKFNKSIITSSKHISGMFEQSHFTLANETSFDEYAVLKHCIFNIAVQEDFSYQSLGLDKITIKGNLLFRFLNYSVGELTEKSKNRFKLFQKELRPMTLNKILGSQYDETIYPLIKRNETIKDYKNRCQKAHDDHRSKREQGEKNV